LHDFIIRGPLNEYIVSRDSLAI